MLRNRGYAGTTVAKKIGFYSATKYQIFQITATTRKKTKLYMKIMDKHRIWSEDQHDILLLFVNEFSRRFIKDLNALPQQAIPLSRDILTPDNEWLTKEATEDEICLAVN